MSHHYCPFVQESGTRRQLLLLDISMGITYLFNKKRTDNSHGCTNSAGNECGESVRVVLEELNISKD